MNNQNKTLIRRKNIEKLLMHNIESCISSSKLFIQTLEGETGTGKSAIMQMFQTDIKEKHPRIKTANASCNRPSESSMPYAPFRELLKSVILPPEQIGELKTDKQENCKSIISAALENTPELIGTFFPGGKLFTNEGKEIIAELGLTEQLERKQSALVNICMMEEGEIFSQYAEILRSASALQPLMLVLDDFHWTDKASVNMLYYLIQTLADCPVFMLISFNSTELSPPAKGENHILVPVLHEIKRMFGNVGIDFNSLPEPDKATFVDEIIDLEENTFDKKFRSSLLQLSNGNPLFVLEMIQLLKENNEIILTEGIWTIASEINWKLKPTRLEGIIEERMSKLEHSSIDLFSHANVQANNFIAQVLSMTLNESEREVLSSLIRKLQKKHTQVEETNCYRSGKDIISTFQFSNFIFQNYIYEELSLNQKKMLHGDIAHCLVQMFQKNINDVALEIARHYEQSGKPENSLEYLIIGGSSIMRISQFEMAIDVLNKALNIVRSAPAADKKTELEICSMLSTCKRNIHGWGNSQVVEAYNKTLELGTELGDIETIAAAQFGIWALYLNQMQLSKAQKYAYDYMASALEINDKAIVVQANIALANTYFWMDKQEKALDCIHQIDDTPIDTENKELTNRFGQAPASLILMFRLMCNYYMGNYENTREAQDEIINYLQTANHPFSKTIVLTSIAWYYYLEGEDKKTLYFAKQLIEIAEKMNFKFYHGLGLLFSYAALMDEYNPKQWFAKIDKAQAMVLDAPGLQLFKTEFEITKARFYIRKAMPAEAEAILHKTVNRVKGGEEQVSKPRIYLYLANSLFKQGKTAEGYQAIEKGKSQLNPNYINSPVRKSLNLIQERLIANE